MNDLLGDFIEGRAEQKKPMTDRAIRMLTRKLDKYPVEIQEMALERAMIAGWSGVFPENERPIVRNNSTRDIPLAAMLNDRSWAK
jgi:hypothetical protein